MTRHSYPLLGKTERENLHRIALAAYGDFLSREREPRMRNQIEWLIDYTATAIFLSGDDASHDAMRKELGKLRSRTAFVIEQWPGGPPHEAAQFFLDFAELIEFSRARAAYPLGEALSDRQVRDLSNDLQLMARDRVRRFGSAAG